MLFGSLVELHAWLRSYLCFSLLEKLFLSNLDTFSTPGYISCFSTSSYCNLDSFSTARWIDQDFFWILDSFSIVGGSIELPLAFCWFVPRQILDSCICRRFIFSTPLSVEIYWTSIYRFCAIRFSFLSISFDSFVFSPPKPLSHSKLLPQGFFKLLQVFLHLVSFKSLIYMHFMFWNLGFRVFEKFWGFSKLMSYWWNFGMGFCLNEFKISFEIFEMC